MITIASIDRLPNLMGGRMLTANRVLLENGKLNHNGRRLKRVIGHRTSWMTVLQFNPAHPQQVKVSGNERSWRRIGERDAARSLTDRFTWCEVRLGIHLASDGDIIVSSSMPIIDEDIAVLAGMDFIGNVAREDPRRIRVTPNAAGIANPYSVKLDIRQALVY